MVEVPFVVGMVGDWKSGKEDVGWPRDTALLCERWASDGGGDGTGRR